jgi:hypothetical protein
MNPYLRFIIKTGKIHLSIAKGHIPTHIDRKVLYHKSKVRPKRELVGNHQRGYISLKGKFPGQPEGHMNVYQGRLDGIFKKVLGGVDEGKSGSNPESPFVYMVRVSHAAGSNVESILCHRCLCRHQPGTYQDQQDNGDGSYSHWQDS